jgi:hypothetical protein
MKLKRSTVTSQILILVLAVFVLLVMIQVAQAQNFSEMPAESLSLAQSTSNQGSFQNQSNSTINKNQRAQVLQIDMPQKSLARRLWDNTTLGYYQQFLGPTPSGSSSETYNIFQEGIDSPNSGRAPLQSFHAVNLRHQINSDWAVGATLSAVNGYTREVQNTDRDGNTFTNSPNTDFFNARAYVGLPPVRFKSGTLFTTVSIEAPTSSISKEQEMRYGWVLAQSYAFALPNAKWNAGLTGQIYRIYYRNNVQAPPFSPALGGVPTPLQTMIISGGPYVNYRMSDRWMVGSVITMDWDQRGLQASSRDFNNNLPHRGRVNLTYFPQKVKYLQSVGLFTQALLKYRNDTTAFGADFSVRF